MHFAKLITLTLGLGLLVAAGPALADGDVAGPGPGSGDHDHDHGDHDGGAHFLKKLNLTDDQKTQVDAIRKKYQPKLKDLMQQLHAEHEAFGQLMTTHPPIDQARSEHKKMQALADQLGDQRFEMMYEIAGVLTPEQRSQLKEMDESGHGHHHHHDIDQ